MMNLSIVRQAHAGRDLIHVYPAISNLGPLHAVPLRPDRDALSDR